MTFTPGVRMGVDVGNARVGLSLCDRDGILATPLKTLRRDLKKNSDRRVLRTLVKVHEVTEIFVGLPKTMSGGESSSTLMARSYAQDLVTELIAEGYSIPVWLVDERLTTVSAHRTLHEAGVSSRDFKTMVDQVAAVNILQYCLDTLKAGNHVAGFLVEPQTIECVKEISSIAQTKNDMENLSEQ
ncbi:Holliday junction resolvase RuvX [Rothia sp. P6271]|uniref:Holliday junction resolvase RuvX n=1 Tax=unclassified Rothia (in: high G+C Gram-positive bacteria) TaxID=2689056 RepID=UPI003AC22F10